MLQAATALAEAKALLPSTQAFGKWCDDNFPEIGKNDRAALIGFSKNLDKARQVLAATERSCPQLIYANEWKVGAAELLGARKSAPTPQALHKKSVPRHSANYIEDLAQDIVKRFAGGPALTARQIADKMNAAFSNVTKALDQLGPQATRLADDTYRISTSRELMVPRPTQVAALELAIASSVGPVFNGIESAEDHHGYEIEDHNAELRKALETQREKFREALAAKDEEIARLEKLAAQIEKALDEAHATINRQQEEIERLRLKVPKGREKGDQPWLKVGVHRGTWWKWSDEKKAAALAKLAADQ
jgi:hypothetical protein